jgi:streptogrisin C
VVRGGRTLAVLPFVVVALLAHSPSASSSELVEVELLSAQEQSLLQAINHARAVHGAPPLRVGVRLQTAARAHSRAMARAGALTHGDWYRRLRRHGVRARTVGETIAWGVGTDGTAASVVRMWLASPPHRATLLRRGFRRIGVGVAIGTMDGFPGATVVTADFAG